MRILTSTAGHAVRMAVDYHIPDVLPHLFYELANYFGVGSIVEGREACCGDLSALNAREMRTLLLGSAALRTHITACFPLDIAEVTDIDAALAYCSAEPRCREHDLKKLWRDLSEHIREGDSPWTALEENGIFDDYIICAPCKDAVETHLRNYREDLWPRLPELFRLVSHAPAVQGSRVTLTLQDEYDVPANWPQSNNP